jgi:hypothetical protein
LVTKTLFTLSHLMLFGMIVLISPTESIEIVLGQTIAATPIVSTRNHFDLDTGELQSGQTSTGYDAGANIPGLQAGTDCPPEIAIYIHGIWVGTNSLENPAEIFDRAKKSIASNNYMIEFIGFSWDSDTKISPDVQVGWLLNL